MSPFPSKDNSNWFGEDSNSAIKDIPVTSPLIINLSSTGVINFTSDSARELIKENFKVVIESGDSCLRILPYSILSKFVKDFRQINYAKLPENFSCTYNNIEYIVSLIPVFSASGNINQVQILLYFEK